MLPPRLPWVKGGAFESFENPLPFLAVLARHVTLAVFWLGLVALTVTVRLCLVISYTVIQIIFLHEPQFCIYVRQHFNN